MPVLDGYSLCERIKESEEFSSVPVVLLTGRFQPFDEKRASAAQIDSRIMKPFVQEQLVELVEQLAGPSQSDVEASPVDDEVLSSVEAEITEDVPFNVAQDNIFEEDELESIDDDFMEEVSMEDEEIPQQDSPETPSHIDTNSTIRVNQEDLQSFLQGNVSLDNEDDDSQSLDSFDLDEVDEFTEEDDFLNEDHAVADTVESELDTTAYIENKDTLVEPEQPEPPISETASGTLTDEGRDELDSVDDFILDDEDDFLEDELEDIELEEVDELLDLEEYDSMNDDGDEWGDILEEPVSEAGDDVISNDLNDLNVAESEPQSMEPAGESLPSLEDVSDATLALGRDEMNDILINEQNVVDTMEEEEKDAPFTVDDEDPFEPDFLTKNTLPLDELEDELNLEADDDADTLPLDVEEEEFSDIEEIEMESQITEPLDNEPGLSPDIQEELEPVDEEWSSDQDSFGIEEDTAETETDPEDFLGGSIEEVDSRDAVVKPMAGGEETIPRSMITDYMESASDHDEPIQESSGFEDIPSAETADVLELGQPELLETEDEVTDLLDVEQDEPEIAMPDEFEPLEEEEALSWHDESTPVSTLDTGADEIPLYEEELLSDSNDPGQEDTEELLFDNDPDAIDEIDTSSEDLSIESEIDDPVRLPDAEPFAMEEPSEVATEQLDDDPKLVFEEEEPDFMQDMEEELEVQVEEVEEPFEMEDELSSPDFSEEAPLEASVPELSEEIEDHKEPESAVSNILDDVPALSPVDPEEEELSESKPEVEDETVVAPAHEEGSVVRLSDEQLNILVNRVAEKVIQALSTDAVKEVAWEVVPALAEVMVERRIFELEKDDQGTS
jgi:hypothetical protein